MNSSVVTVTLNPALDKTIAVDKLKVGGLNRVADVRLDPGGKGINVAKVLNKFGADVLAAGLIAGFQGQFVLKYLEDQNIRSNFIRVEGETRVNLKIIEENTREMTEINEAGFIVSNRDMEQLKEAVSSFLESTSILVLSGSLPQGVRSDIYKDFIHLAASKGVRTILDADGEALEEGIKALPYAIKPNVHELEKLFGQKISNDIEIVHYARQLIKDGIKLVIVSKGADGAVVLDESDNYSIETFRILPKSTVGAGDSMVAALAYALNNNMNITEICKWVTAAGTITASKEGTQVCKIEEVLEALDKVKVIKILV